MCSDESGADGSTAKNGATHGRVSGVTYGRVQHAGKNSKPEDEHQFCVHCGYCSDCGDCAIWGCGQVIN